MINVLKRPATNTLVVAWLCLAGVASAQELASVFLKGPYLQGPGTDTMTIKWEAPTNTPAILRYGLRGKMDRQLRIETPRPLAVESYNFVTNAADNGETSVARVATMNLVYLYEIALTNLEPESVYTYSAQIEGVRTAPKKFK